jgi:hypothetical protein
MTEAGRSSSRLVALVCPACGAELDGLAADRVFGCSACAKAFSVEPDGLAASSFAAWEPEQEGAVVFLPLWTFEIEATVVLPPKPRTSHAPGLPAPGDRLVPFDEGVVHVTAFELIGRGRFGDPGLHLTRRRPAYRLREGSPPRLAGATLGRKAAERLIPATLLAVLDAREDVFGAKVDVRVVSATLALVPFADREDGGVVEPFGGIGYARAAIPDLEAIRAAGRA